MKTFTVVKEFEDPEFMALSQISPEPGSAERFKWFWGLSDDGDIFFRCTRFTDPNEWMKLERSDAVAAQVSLRTMKKLVKEFGHLLVYL